MEYMQLSMDDYIQSKNEIKQELGGIVKSFVRIGWQLTRIDKSQAFKHDGYNTISEFAKAEYGMNASGVTKFMKVYEKCSVSGDTPELQEQYRNFKFNVLAELIRLPEEDQKIFLPTDKREDIRELKDFNKENKNNPMNLLDWKSAQSTEDKLHATIQEFFREKHGVLNTLYASEAYQTGNIKEMAQIINPGDSMSYRKGTVFLMFHQEDITVKIFNGEMKTISWEQFFTYVQEVFAEAAAGAKTYENYFGIPEETPAPTPKETPKPASKPVPEHNVRPEPEIAPAQHSEPVENVENSVDKSQKTAVEQKEAEERENTSSDMQLEEPKTESENVEKSQETALTEPETQIPGQDSIENHPEYMPKPVEEPEKQPGSNLESALQEDHPGEVNEMVPEESRIALAQSESEPPAAEFMTRKEYIDTLTAFGTAEYLAKAMKSFSNKTYNTLLDKNFWNEWLEGKVDHNGRPWEE